MTGTGAETLDVPKKRAANGTVSKMPTSPAIPKFAMNAVNAQVGRVSEILTTAADAIDELGKNSALALPDGAKGFVSSASAKLRDLADRATEEEAGSLIKALQRNAADHPIAAAGIGAAIGTALGIALSRLSRPAR